MKTIVNKIKDTLGAIGSALLVAGLIAVAVGGLGRMTVNKATAQNQYWAPATVVYAQPVAATVVPFSGVWTNKIAASTAFGNMTKIDLTGLPKGDLWMEVNARADAAGTGLLNVMIGANATGIVTGTNATSNTNVYAQKLVGFALAGTAQVGCVTNLSTFFGAPGGVPPYLFINYITNADASANVTNYNIRIFSR